MSEAVHIKYLAEVPHFVPTLAQWTIQAWGKYDPSLNLQNATESIKAKLNTDKIPLTLVAVVADKPVGMVSLKAKVVVKGYENRDLWLGSFWVDDESRNLGVGTKLLEQVYEKARELGYKKISLFASDPRAPEWYARHGWKKFAEDTYQTHPVVLMEYYL